jgi:hypothetical protein
VDIEQKNIRPYLKISKAKKGWRNDLSGSNLKKGKERKIIYQQP